MPVSSYLELVLTTFGWHLYDIIWSVMSDTGLAYIPIISIIIKNVIDPIKSQEARGAATTSLRRIEIDIISIIIVMMIAVSPSFTINYGEPTLSSACTNTSFKEGNSGTTYDQVFGPQIISNQVAKVPPWFYLVMTVSGGINNAVISALPCDINIRQMKVEASSARIKDVQLKGEVNRFINECYATARADYFYGTNTIQDEEQIAWIGSQYFLDNRYKQIYSSGPVKGWPVNLSRESDASHYGSPIPLASGYPACDEWWLDSQKGLRSKLLAQYPPGVLTKLGTLFQDQKATENASIRKLLQNEKQSGHALDLTNAPDFGSYNGPSLTGTLKGAAEWVGGGITAVTVSFITDFVVMAAPFVQGLALFSIYFLLPFALVFGNYEWSTIRTASVTIFAIKFWSAIWAVLVILDNKLTIALTVRDGLHPIDYISISIGFTAIIANLLIAAMYITLPAFFMVMLSWAGERHASAGSEMANSASGSAKGAGSSGAGVARSAAGKAGIKSN